MPGVSFIVNFTEAYVLLMAPGLPPEGFLAVVSRNRGAGRPSRGLVQSGPARARQTLGKSPPQALGVSEADPRRAVGGRPRVAAAPARVTKSDRWQNMFGKIVPSLFFVFLLSLLRIRFLHESVSGF